MLECLGERTVALAQLRKLHDPAGGYDPLLEAAHDRPVAADPAQRRARRHQHGRGEPARRRGEDRGARAQARPEGARRGAHRRRRARRCSIPVQTVLETGEPLSSVGRLFSANAYLGVEEMLPALESGADIVLTGRVADPSLALAPLAHHFGWRLDDVERFARGTVVGHLLECAGQLTGGYYADPGKKDVSGMATPRLSVRRRGCGRQCAALQGRGHRRHDQPHDGDRAAALRGDRSARRI